MSIVWFIIAISLLLVVVWLLFQPKQGTRASNSPPSTPPEGLPSGVEQAVRPQDNPESFHRKRTQTAPPQSPVLQIQPEKTQATPPQSLEEEIQQLLDSGQKIAAIKRVREMKHWGLKEAKDYVDALEKYESPPLFNPPVTSEPAPELRQEVKRLLADHAKVAAVKLVRETHQWDLRKAKDYVDAIQDEEFQLMNEEVSNLLSDPTLKEEVQRLVMNHQRFDAVERVKNAMGWELRQAMVYVNGVEQDLESP